LTVTSPNEAEEPPVETVPTLPPDAAEVEEPPVDDETPPCPPLAFDTPDVLLELVATPPVATPPVAEPPAAEPPAPPLPPVATELESANDSGLETARATAIATGNNDFFISLSFSGRY
jgi:hypothetical protein